MLRFLSPLTYTRKAREIWHRFCYDPAAVRRDEETKFTECGFDSIRGKAELNRQLAALGLPIFDACSGMASVHWLLFACLAQKQPIRRILEIGTFDGETTALLARLFPEGEIVTLDLPSTDPILASTYGFARGDPAQLEDFERRLRDNTAAKNITLLRVNSFFLPAKVTGEFDLIWIDGGHLYPEIAWDICNAYHLVRDGGFVMCDDVIPHPKGWRDEYVSPDSYTILRYVTDRTGDSLRLFLKRESPAWSADPRRRKYVALLTKGRAD